MTSVRPVPVSTEPPAGGAGGRVAVAGALTAASAVSLLVVLTRWAMGTREGQEWDQTAMESVYGGSEAMRRVLGLLGEVSIGSAALVLGVCVVLAVLRRRYAAAVAAVVLVGGANVTTQLLKRVVLERPDFGNLTVVSLPSGHTTVVASLALAALLVVPRVLQPATLLGGTALTVITAGGTVVAQWHRPADVVASLLVCLAWTGAVVAVLALRRPGRTGSGVVGDATAALMGAVLAGVVLLVAGVRPTGGWTGFGDAAVVLGLIGLAAAGAVTLGGRLARPFSA